MWMTVFIVLLLVNLVLQFLDFSVIVAEAKKEQKLEILEVIEGMKSDECRTVRDEMLIGEIWIKIYTFF